MKRARFWDFDRHIFTEGVRQLKLVGILFSVVMCLESLLIPIGMMLARQNTDNPLALVTTINVHPFIVLPMYLLAPIAVLILFSFLNKRSGCDFYHAAPISRAALFISLFAAVLFWVLLAVVTSTAVSVATCLCLPRFIQLDLTGIGILLLNTVLGAAFVAAGTALAVSITGTLFNSLIVACLIFFAPRLLFTVFDGIIQSNVHILAGSSNSLLPDVSYNIPLGLIAGVISSSAGVQVLYSYKSAAYTAVMAFAFFLLANLLLRLRKSEAAGNAAATPWLQHVYRLTITFLVTLLPVFILCYTLLSNDDTQVNAFYILVTYILAAIVFCVYELITTKKPKQLLRVSWSFLAVLAADGIMILGVCLSCNALLSYRPTADEITGVSFFESDSNSYFTARSQEVILRDPQVHTIISDRLATCAEANSVSGDLDIAEVEYYQLYVRIYTGKQSQTRCIGVTAEEMNTIEKAMSGSAAYRDIVTLPARSSGLSVTHPSLTAAQCDALYDTLHKEAQRLSFEQLYGLLMQNEYPTTDGYCFTDISVSISYRTKIYYFCIPLTADYFPESYALYLSYRYRNTEAMQEELLAGLSNENIIIEAYDNAGAPPQQLLIHSLQFSAEQQRTVVNGLIRKAPTVGDSFCRIRYYDDEHNLHEAFFTLSEDARTVLCAIGKEF